MECRHVTASLSWRPLELNHEIGIRTSLDRDFEAGSLAILYLGQNLETSSGAPKSRTIVVFQASLTGGSVSAP